VAIQPPATKVKSLDSAEGAVVATVRQYPVRTRCAMLPWLTLEAALDGRAERIFVR